MVKIRLRYLSEDVDRHGNPRCYVRRKGHPKIRIKGVPGSAEFMKAYHEAIAGIEKPKPEAEPSTVPRGSLEWLCRMFYSSSEFKTKDISTQNWRRRALDRICLKHGKGPAKLLETKHLRAMREELAATPGAANTRVKALKALFSWAVEAVDEIDRNPARDLKLIRYKTDGHHSWTLKEVEQFEERHPIGSKARLAMSLLLYTACRREDAPRLGRSNIKDGRISFVQGKNQDRSPVVIDIPIHTDLAAVLLHTDPERDTFLVTAYGKQFTTAGFGNWFRDRCDDAGLPHCSAHGLRKAAAARLAERGATAKEIMAITGHQSLEEVEVYTRKADNARLADSAMLKLMAPESPRTVSHPGGFIIEGEAIRSENDEKTTAKQADGAP